MFCFTKNMSLSTYLCILYIYLIIYKLFIQGWHTFSFQWLLLKFLYLSVGFIKEYICLSLIAKFAMQQLHKNKQNAITYLWKSITEPTASSQFAQICDLQLWIVLILFQKCITIFCFGNFIYNLGYIQNQYNFGVK